LVTRTMKFSRAISRVHTANLSAAVVSDWSSA